MVDRDGRVREPWSAVAPVLAGLGVDELGRRRDEAVRLLADDGVTYEVYGEQEGGWRLDPVPSVLPSDEWANIERGIIQRAELLNLVLADLYGPRELLRRRLLPPAVVFGHPGFLRSWDGVRTPLLTCAFDLGRDDGGATWVLADRAQAPSGAGYAMENRRVTSRVLPSLYRDAQVHRLAPFFRALRTALESAAPAGATEPRIVVLTPGRLAETSFEHAFLASYLGYPLVEGADLVMRDGRVWLRSLGRREPVDVILRRLDAWFCDPLELRDDSHLGIPGLVEACRLGTVSVVNPLGSGVLENPGLHAYLPAIAERLLGQPLLLPSVPTWWCGDDDGRRRVLSELDRLVLRPLSGQSFQGWRLDSTAKAELRARIEARPYGWVGQQPVNLSSAPTLTSSGLAPRPGVLRAFVVARGESYAAMPGGLTRVAPTDDDAPITNQAGAINKDTWVLSSEPEPSAGYWLRDGPPTAATESIPSRAAENLFWFGRYAERAESLTRLLRVVHDRRNDFAHGAEPAGAACLEVLLAALPGPDLESLMFDRDREGTLAHAARRLIDDAYAVRDLLSNDTWLLVADLDRELLRRRRGPGRATLGRVMRALLALSGLADESLVRDPGWRFLDTGRRIERAVQLLRLLRACVTVERDTATDSLLLESVLIATESIVTYRRRYRSRAQLETVLDLLLLDPANPRSLAFQLARLTEATDALPGARTAPWQLTEAGRRVLEASTRLRLADTAVLASGSRRVALDELLDELVTSLNAVAEAVTVAHFVHLLPQRALVGGP